jgi:hypothetical protein
MAEIDGEVASTLNSELFIYFLKFFIIFSVEDMAQAIFKKLFFFLNSLHPEVYVLILP